METEKRKIQDLHGHQNLHGHQDHQNLQDLHGLGHQPNSSSLLDWYTLFSAVQHY